MNIGATLRSKRKEILAVAARNGARNVRVFGSVARGDARLESDIDLLVELADDRSLLDVVAIKQDIEDLLAREVHIVTEGALSPYIREDVLKEAVAL